MAGNLKREIGMNIITITDLKLVSACDQWGAVAELEDGTEIPVWAVNGNDCDPPWLNDEKEYEYWYNLALEEAHRQGLFLEGELDSRKYNEEQKNERKDIRI